MERVGGEKRRFESVFWSWSMLVLVLRLRILAPGDWGKAGVPRPDRGEELE